MATGTTNVSTSELGDGSTTEFSFDWRVLDAANVKVKTIDGDDLTESDLEYGVDYTVAVNTNGVGGTVTFSSAPADGDEVFIYRDTPLVQSLELEGIGNLSEKSLEQSYDRAILIAQELLDKVNRAFRLASNSTSAFDLTLPADLATANAVLAVNATGDALRVGPTTTEIENAETNATEAAASATAAAASAASAASSAANTASSLASAFFSDVVFYNAASSPVTLDSDANGKLHVFDSSAGAITVNLPEISGETMPFNMAVLCSADGNDVTFNRGGSSDTIQGGASKVLNVANTGFQLIADTDPTPDTWSVLEFGSVGDGTVTPAKTNFPGPTVQKFTSGSGTYTTPAGVKRIEIQMVGAGGGGSGAGGASAGNGTSGTNTLFGTALLNAGGGIGAIGRGAGGNGGTGSLGGADGFVIAGSKGNGSTYIGAAAAAAGASGANSFFGGAGASNYGAAGTDAAANSGSGGGGGGTASGSNIYSGAGGGAGAYLQATIDEPESSYSYTVGGGGTGGSAGPSGFAGGDGADGIIIVKEFYV